MEEEPFEPRLGRIGVKGNGARRYLSRVLSVAMRHGLKGRRSRAGGRRGRGGVAARMLGQESRARMRRAIVKTRLIRLGRGSAAAMRAHLRYLQRDGVQPDGSRGALYDAASDRADGRAFLDSCQGDRHQFRLIVSAEDGDQYPDLKPLVREFVARMEADLGTRLQWVAVDHRDTAHPHSHIILRGKDEQGQNLVISRDYIARGMRERLGEILTLDLGPRRDEEIQKRLKAEIKAERLTSIDRGLIAEAGLGRAVNAFRRSPFQHSLRAGRLKTLERLGLAEPLGEGRWQLAEGIGERLRRLGERGDIIRTMQRALKSAGIDRASADLVHHGEMPAAPLVGRYIGRGLLDEQSGRQHIILDAVDGRTHSVDLGAGGDLAAIPPGAIVRLEDRERNGGNRVRLQLLSPLGLAMLPDRQAATWLDAELASGKPLPLRDAGFGRELKSALAARRAWLLANGLAAEAEGSLRFAGGTLAALADRELQEAAARLSSELGRNFAQPDASGSLEGRFSRRVDLAQGSFALIQRAREFTLVPWTPAIDGELGKEVRLELKGASGWTLAPGRGLER